MQRLRDSYHDVRPVAEFEQLDRELTAVKEELAKAKMQLGGREVSDLGELRRELTRLRKLEQDTKGFVDPAPLLSQIEDLKRQAEKSAQAEQAPAGEDDTAALRAELKKVKAELNRQIQINGAQAARGKKKKGGK